MGLRILLMSAALVVTLTGCSRLGNPVEILSGNRPTPDEFRVKTTEPLVMPRTTSLPEPRLGARSPRERDPDAQARAALGGAVPVARTGVTPGEAALTSAAVSSAQSGPTGTTLASAEEALDRGKAYEPPTVLELLNLDEGVKGEDVLDPDTEARRLRTGGPVMVPVNPAETSGEEGEDDSGYVSPGKKFEPQFPYGNQKKGS